MSTPGRTEYEAPGHVVVLQLLAALSFLVGALIIATSEFEIEALALGVGGLVSAIYLLIASYLANNAAQANWRIDQLQRQLAPALRELEAQAADRARRDRAAEAEARRAAAAHRGDEE